MNEEKNRVISAAHRLGLALLMMVMILPNLWAAGEGTTGASFLNIGTSARAAGMGGAYTAAVDDVDSTFWNPAGLMQLQRSTVGLTHLEWFQDIRYEYVSYASKFDYVGAIGVNLGFLYLGDIPKTVTTLNGTDYDPEASQKLGTFGASDLLLDFAWAGRLGFDENMFGVAVKIIQESIDDNASFSVALDLGEQYLIDKSAWYQSLAETSWTSGLIPNVVSLVVKNLGTPVKYFNQNDPLPLSASLGAAYKFFDDHLTAAVDFNYLTMESLAGINVGAEYWYDNLIQGDGEHHLDVALRAGYRTGYDATSAPGFAFGGGLRYGGLIMDYVYMPFGDLGSTHRVSLKVSWGDILKDKMAAKPKKTVKKNLSASERELLKTANRLVRQKREMEGKTSIQKSEAAKRSMTAVEAKKPEDHEVVKETKSLGAEIEASKDVPREVVIGKGAIIKARSSKVDSELIAKITSASKMEPNNNRTRSKYMRRTQEDVVRAARREAERQSQAMNAVEEAAKQEAGNQATQVKGKLVTRTTVYFARNSFKLNDRYLFALDKIAVSFDRYPERTILVHGHASGDEGNKKELSLKRAAAVKEYLIQIKSIPNNKVAIKALADTQPLAEEKDAKGKARNRCVRVQLIKSGN